MRSVVIIWALVLLTASVVTGVKKGSSEQQRFVDDHGSMSFENRTKAVNGSDFEFGTEVTNGTSSKNATIAANETATVNITEAPFPTRAKRTTERTTEITSSNSTADDDFTIKPNNQYADTDTDAVFECQARDTDKAEGLTPTYTWYVDGTAAASSAHTLSNNVSVLTVNATKELDGKVVKCKASYTGGVEIEAQALLYSKSISLKPNTELYAVVGEKVNITCTYSSTHTDGITVEWYKGYNKISGAGFEDYKIYDTVESNKEDQKQLVTVLELLAPSLSYANNQYMCNFKFTDGADRNVTATIKNVLGIDTQPSDQSLTSGYTATFSTAVIASLHFTTSYAWYKDSVKLSSNADQASYTTPQLMYTSDAANSYYCVIVWTDSYQTLTTTTNTAKVVITDSCKVVDNTNNKTTIDNSDAYVVDDTKISISCSKGYILKTPYLYDNHCDVDEDLIMKNCTGGCWLNNPFTTNYTTYTIADTHYLNSSSGSYSTVHFSTVVRQTCASTHTIRTSVSTNIATCTSTGGMKELAFDGGCVIGCAMNSNFHVAPDSVPTGLVAKSNTVSYKCSKYNDHEREAITKSGGVSSTSGTCTNGETLQLDDCIEVTVPRPDETIRIQSIKLEFTSYQSTEYSPVPQPSKHLIKLYTGSTNTLIEKKTVLISEAHYVVFSNGLTNNTDYSYQITSTWSGGAVHTTTQWSFTTKDYTVVAEDTPDTDLTLDVPLIDFAVDTYDIVMIYVSKDYLGQTEDLTLSTAARKRSTAVIIYSSLQLMKDAIKNSDPKLEIAAFVAATITASQGASGSYMFDASELDLPNSASYITVVQACDPADSSSCVTGAKTTLQKGGSSVGLVLGLAIPIPIALIIFIIIIIILIRQYTYKTGLPKGEMVIIPNPGWVDAEDDHAQEMELEEQYEKFEPHKVINYLQYYKHLMADQEYHLTGEWDELRRRVPPDSFTYHAARNTNVKTKNRYMDILPYDETRVVLMASDEPFSDYINANYIKNMQGEVEFIAAQGPKEETIPDFWRLVWENKCLTIVMVTNYVEKGRVKCSKYFSDDGQVTYGEITVMVQSCILFPDYAARSMLIKKTGEPSRIITHFHYLVWPDHGVPPTTSLIDFCRRCFSEKADGPVVVHCSAGVGRTGTLIVLKLQMRLLAEEQMIDIFGITKTLRQCRKLMVQAEAQYKFLYDAVREILLCGDTAIPVENFTHVLSRMVSAKHGSHLTTMDEEYRKLVDYTEGFKHSTTHATMECNQSKNRYANVLPYNDTRVRLMVTTGVEGSDYINASYVNSFHQTQQYIATQGPKGGTIGEFWRMVFEKDCCVIVMMTHLVERNREKCAQYWPAEQEGSISADGIMVHLLSETQPDPSFVVRTFNISLPHQEERTARTIKQFHYTDWSETHTPESGIPLIKMMTMVKTNNKEGAPIAVHCSAGIGRTAAFIAISNCIEQLQQDYIIDLFQVVLKMRQMRPAMIQSVDQYKFCYRVLHQYLEEFNNNNMYMNL